MSRTPNDDRLDEAVAASGLNRREFMRLGGALAATTAMTSAGCKMPTEEVVPFHERPEDANTLGKARFYATVLGGLPVLARTRESRPILITPNGDHPSGLGMTVRSQAALLDLYDPDRASGPLSLRRGKGAPVETSWQAVTEQVVRRLKEAKGDAVLLTPPQTGPATRALLHELDASNRLRHVSYAPIESDAAVVAWEAVFGDQALPRPNLALARLVVGFGAEFLDQPDRGLERQFAERRQPDHPSGMSQLVQLEGRLTLTGANADRRVRVRDSQLAAVASAIAHEIILGARLGPLAGDAAVRAALEPFAPAAVAKHSGVDAATLKALAKQLVAAKGFALALAGGSASATAQGVALELATILINHSLGAYDSSLFDAAAAHTPAHGGMAALGELTEKMRAGQVKTLILAGTNPVYDGPPSLGFAEAMSKVEQIVSLNDRSDETSALADWLAPASHPLECWADVDLGSSRLAIQQPVIQPLYDTYGLLDILVTWGAAAGLGGAVARAAKKSKTPEAGATADGARAASAAYHYLRSFWGGRYLRQPPGKAAFEKAWSEVLRQGYWQSAKPEAPEVEEVQEVEKVEEEATADSFKTEALQQLGQPAPPSALELQLYPHFALHDGAAGNNGWLLEFPDPVTRITWEGGLSLAPRRFDEMGLEQGDLIELSVGDAKLVAPAYRHAGMHQDVVALALGQGRTKAGLIGAEVGVNGFTLQQVAEGRVVRAGLGVALRKTGGRRPLAFLQETEVLDRDRRPLVPVTTLSKYESDPSSGTEQPPGGPSAWREHEYAQQRWAMAIDLSRCNGCGKCTVACQAENNIPVVGPDRVREGRSMAWIKIDRYYDAPPKEGRWGAEVWDGPLEVVEEPLTLFEPMLCQHCENAPCETVCPFNATMHSSDGLNQQIYNRCVGTRYCANNCPFKVRRYNWYEYSFAQSSSLFRLLFPEIKDNAVRNTRGQMPLKNNPEVTVRSRGVMEKCSFCVQRIREARAEALRQGRPGKIPDGEVVPACMEACPTGAIAFGDANDSDTRVSALSTSPRAMRLLDLVGVKPAISYLTKVRNDNA